MPVPLQLIVACWIVFIVYWIASARNAKPVAERPSRASTLLYRAPLFAGGFLIWSPNTGQLLKMSVSPHPLSVQAMAVVVSAFGVFLAIWSRRILAGNWSSEVTFKQGHELIQTGPYRFVRHPIYTAILLMFMGTVLAEGQLHCWLGIAIVFAGLWIKLRQEESLMLRHFPEDYPSYRGRVSALIPYII